MDYRCPICRLDVAQHKPARSVIARMETDCPHCMNRLALNLHPLERGMVIGCFVAFVALGFLGYASQNRELLLLALGVGGAGVFVTPLLARTRLRDWPRYKPAAPATPGDGSRQ